MFNLQWYCAGDDLAFKHEPYVFRLHKDFLLVKEDPRSNQHKQEVKVYDLQYRKIENSDFKSLGYLMGLGYINPITAVKKLAAE